MSPKQPSPSDEELVASFESAHREAGFDGECGPLCQKRIACRALFEAGREAGRAERDEAVLNLTQCLRGLRVWFEEHIEVTDSPGTLGNLKANLAYIDRNLKQHGAK